jgi:hypothetical protein
MQTRKQVYQYSSKVAGPAGRGVATWQTGGFGGVALQYGLGLTLINPVNLLTIEGLVTAFRASGITAGAKIIGIGVADNDVNPFANINLLTTNIVQDGSGVIQFTKSLAGILLPSKQNVVNLMFDRATTLTIEMWKNDMLYTVQGLK